jgi:hypothetical protein
VAAVAIDMEWAKVGRAITIGTIIFVHSIVQTSVVDMTLSRLVVITITVVAVSIFLACRSPLMTSPGRR